MLRIGFTSDGDRDGLSYPKAVAMLDALRIVDAHEAWTDLTIREALRKDRAVGGRSPSDVVSHIE